MALDVKQVEYFKITLDSSAIEAYKLLSAFADIGVSLLAFKAIPAEPGKSQFSLFPNDTHRMRNRAKEEGILTEGPFAALIIKSDSDEAGECADIFRKLSEAGIKIEESAGIADIRDAYGVVLYLKQEDCAKAVAVLQG